MQSVSLLPIVNQCTLSLENSIELVTVLKPLDPKGRNTLKKVFFLVVGPLIKKQLFSKNPPF